MDDKRQITSLVVPTELVVNSAGLSMDFGGSMIKIVYREEQEYQEAKENIYRATGKLQLTSFRRSERMQAFQFMKDHAHITHDAEGSATIYTTGVGSSEYAEEIREILNMKVENLNEGECFVEAFHYLCSHINRLELLRPIHHEAVLDAVQEMEALLPGWKIMVEKEGSKDKTSFGGIDALMKQLKQDSLSMDLSLRSSRQPLVKAECIYPCLLVMLGSALGFIKVFENGDYAVVDFTSMGGRALHGLANLLLGTKDYGEFLALAEIGNPKAVHFHASDLQTDSMQGDSYGDQIQSGMLKMDPLGFFFGKATLKDRDDLKKEDIASALMVAQISDLAHKTHLIACKAKVQHVFLAGGALESTLARKIFTREFTKRNIWPDSEYMERHIIKLDIFSPGPQLGALGAFIHSFVKSA